VKEQFADRITNLSGRISNVWRAISDEFEDAKENFVLPTVPKARKAEEIKNSLYDSHRDYCEQLKIYKEFQGK